MCEACKDAKDMTLDEQVDKVETTAQVGETKDHPDPVVCSPEFPEGCE
ncbi:MAG: hypothetical protein ACK5LX_07155 [Oscillospiraceae bacterium]